MYSGKHFAPQDLSFSVLLRVDRFAKFLAVKFWYGGLHMGNSSAPRAFNRRRIAGLLLGVGAAVILMSVSGVLDGERAKYIHVRWRSGVSADERSSLEARFSLALLRPLDVTTFAYELLDDSWWNIYSLVRHPAVDDTHHLDRQRYAIASTAPDGESGRRTGIAWRWGVEWLVPYGLTFGIALLAAGASVRLASQRRVTALLILVSGTVAWARRPPPAGFAALGLLAVSLLHGEDLRGGQSDTWIPWVEASAWAPFQQVITSSLLGVGALLTYRVAARHSRFQGIPLVIAAMTVWIFPARASEAGFLLYAVMLWTVDRYLTQPHRYRLWLLTLVTALVAVIRIDHALYLTVAAMAAIYVRHRIDGANASGMVLEYIGSLAVIGLLFVPSGEVFASLGTHGARMIDGVAMRGGFLGPQLRERSGTSPVVEETFNIRWAPGVDANTRVGKERQYELLGGRADTGDASGRTWRYLWDGRSTSGVRRMLADPTVEDTQGIDRASGVYVGGAVVPLGAALLRRARDAGSTAARAAGWLWLTLPILAAIRIGRAAWRRTVATAELDGSLWVLPAVMLCMPVARLVIDGAGDVTAVAGPVLPALTVVAAWLFTGPAPRTSTQEAMFALVPTPTATRPGEAATRSRHTWVCIGLTALTVIVHLYVNTGISNDHAGYLAMGRQVVYGDWPIRDFRDDGWLLQVLLSAAVQKVAGFHLLGEMALAWSFLAASTCITFFLAFRLSRSQVASVATAALAALLVPRPYGYPKLFIYPFAILVLWRYIERPSVRRVAVVGATSALAFLFRIDHGAVIFATSLVTVGFLHARAPAEATRRVAHLIGWTLVFALPQLAYVMATVGLPRYAESIITLGAYANATREAWPIALSLRDGLFTETNAAVFLLDLFLLIAGTALVVAVVQMRRAWLARTDPPRESLYLLVVVVMWGLMLPMLARGQYYTRIAEIGTPIAVLSAWLAIRWLETDIPQGIRRLGLASVIAAVAVALCVRIPMSRFFLRPDEVFRDAPFQPRVLQALATSPPIDSYAPKEISGDRWIARYAYECTRPNDRLLVAWFAPEVYFYSGRPFAGDRWVYLAFDNSAARQREVIERMRVQSVPLVFVNVEQFAEFRAAWPRLAEYLHQAYSSAAEVPTTTGVTRVLALKSRIPSRRVSFANLPCFE